MVPNAIEEEEATASASSSKGPLLGDLPTTKGFLGLESKTAKKVFSMPFYGHTFLKLVYGVEVNDQ